jgi:hypothetical protein
MTPDKQSRGTRKMIDHNQKVPLWMLNPGTLDKLSWSKFDREFKLQIKKRTNCFKGIPFVCLQP